jgi:hypothetical protein
MARERRGSSTKRQFVEVRCADLHARGGASCAVLNGLELLGKCRCRPCQKVLICSRKDNVAPTF